MEESKKASQYELVRRIGQGSFGIVNLCRAKDGCQVVVKEINLSSLKKEERESAEKEAEVLSTLDYHHYVVRYIESFLHNNNLYIVMEYCDGGDLAQRIALAKKNGKFFKEEKVMKWFVQMALGLEAIHSHNILHRDLKSQNIFLTGSGEDAKIGDFGISKVLTSDTELAQTVIGTPYYLSPEICEGRPYSKGSDIWSLGCILYEIVTLRRAFTGKNLPNLVLKILRGKYPPIPDIYSKKLARIIESMLRQDPKLRPPIEQILALDACQEAFVAMGFSFDEDESLASSPTSQQSKGTAAKDGKANSLKSTRQKEQPQSTAGGHRGAARIKSSKGSSLSSSPTYGGGSSSHSSQNTSSGVSSRMAQTPGVRRVKSMVNRTPNPHHRPPATSYSATKKGAIERAVSPSRVRKEKEQLRRVSSKVKTSLSEEEKRRKRLWLEEQQELKRQKREEERQRLARFKSGIKEARSRLHGVIPSPAFRRAKQPHPEIMVINHDNREQPRTTFRQPNFDENDLNAVNSSSTNGRHDKSKHKGSGDDDGSRVKRGEGKGSSSSKPGGSSKRMRAYMKRCRAMYGQRKKKQPQFELVLAPSQKAGASIAEDPLEATMSSGALPGKPLNPTASAGGGVAAVPAASTKSTACAGAGAGAGGDGDIHRGNNHSNAATTVEDSSHPRDDSAASATTTVACTTTVASASSDSVTSSLTAAAATTKTTKESKNGGENSGSEQRTKARERLEANIAKVKKFCSKILGEELYDKIYKHLRKMQSKEDEEEDGEDILKKLLKTGKQWSCLKHMNGIIYCEDVIASTSM